MNFLTSIIFFLFVLIIGILPFKCMYIFSDFIAWFLRRVMKYRHKVIHDNLTKSDLVLTEDQKKEFIRQVYTNLSDIILEGIKSFTMTRKSVLKRHKVLNPDLVETYYRNKQSLILVTGHLGNWEWGSLSAGLQTPYHILGFYKPLKNKLLDRFLRWSRSRFGTTLAPIKKTSLSFQKHSNHPTMYLMAADQSPSKIAYAYWTNFLGRKTAFLHGPEKHSRNNNYPLIFADIKRVKRGKYELELSVLEDNPSALSQGEITNLYAQKLDSIIRTNPANWLWTHRRWKHQFSNTN